MRQKLTLLYILLYSLLIFLLTILNSSVYINRQGVFNTISVDYLIVGISTMVIFVLIINGFLVRLLMQYVEKEAEINIQAAYTESLNDLFQTIKSQRHDFNNHVLVLYGMITQNLIDAAKQYITDVFKEVKEINEIMVVDRPEVAALFRAKHSKAALNNIGLKIYVNCNLSILKIKPHELVRILGNLLDNAIEATALLGTPKEVVLLINRQDSKIYIETNNPGDIPQETISSLFMPGVSMKDGHSGLGLYIVNKIIESYNGEICVESSNGRIRFLIKLPCSK